MYEKKQNEKEIRHHKIYGFVEGIPIYGKKS